MTSKPAAKEPRLSEDAAVADTQVSPQAGASAVADTQVAPPALAITRAAAGPLHDPDAATLDAPQGAAPPLSVPDLLPLPDADRYDIHGEIARGGLGRILEATDRRLRRPVAIKELLIPGGALESRFLREAEITARLQHPAIIPLYDAGRGRDGEPFFSMKLVLGRSLEEVIATKKTLTERLSLLPHVIHVAEAIAYAHSKRIIHRDLKPQNVLVGEFGETVVIDWGIAKDLSRQGADSGTLSATANAWRGDLSSDLTQDGAIIGTPAYMPPEQARGEAVDERVDVYALGAILYHLMAGVPPYDDRDLREILRKLLARPPMPPMPLEQRIVGVPKDLCAIVKKALAPNPEDRYPSAEQLAADLQKFQTGQIVGAYRYTSTELALRWLKRNRLVASLLVLLVAGAAVSVASILDRSRVAEERRQLAEIAQAKAEAAEARERSRADEVTLEQARLSLDHDPQKSLDFLAALSPSFPRMRAARIIAADALSREPPRTLRGHRSAVFGVSFAPNGKLVASGSYDKTLRVWDVQTGGSRLFEGHTAEVTHVVFSPDSKRVCSASYDKTLRLWDLDTGEGETLSGHAEWISFVLFAPDGQRLFSAAADGEIRVWDLSKTPATARVLVGHTDLVTTLALSPDASRLISRSTDGTARLWDLSTGESEVFERDIGEARGMTGFSPDGALVATTDSEGQVRLREVQSRAMRALGAKGMLVRRVVFLPDGKRMAGSDDQSILHVWQIDTGNEVATFRGHEEKIDALLVLPDGNRLLTGSQDWTLRTWDLDTGESEVLRAHSGPVTGVALSPDGSRVASSSLDATVRLWTHTRDRSQIAKFDDLPNDVLVVDEKRVAVAVETPELRLCSVEQKKCELVSGHSAAVRRLARSPDGKRLASASDDKTIRVWDVSGGAARLVQVFSGHTDKVRDVAFMPDGKRLVSASLDHTVRVWDLATGEDRVLVTHADGLVRAIPSPDGARVASVSRDKVLRLTEVETGASKELAGHTSLIMGITFSPNGELLASASLDRTLRLWDTRTGAVRVLPANDGGLYGAAFSPGGELVATGSDVGVLRVWEVATGKSRALRGHGAAVLALGFSRDGRTIATASRDGTARLWDVETGESRALRGHHQVVRRVMFSPDDRRVFTTGDDGAVRVWEDELPSDEALLRARIASVAAPVTVVEE